jgi:hypothetical protein
MLEEHVCEEKKWLPQYLMGLYVLKIVKLNKLAKVLRKLG